jgi:WD40 repeat protein
MFLLFRNCLPIICLLGCLGRVQTQRLELKVPLAHSDAITAIAFSPDGRYALSGSADNHLRLWEVATGREVRSFTGHADKVIAAAFSPDGKHILSAAQDYSLKTWDVVSGRPLHTVTGDFHEAAAFSPPAVRAVGHLQKGRALGSSHPQESPHPPETRRLDHGRGLQRRRQVRALGGRRQDGAVVGSRHGQNGAHLDGARGGREHGGAEPRRHACPVGQPHRGDAPVGRRDGPSRADLPQADGRHHLPGLRPRRQARHFRLQRRGDAVVGGPHGREVRTFLGYKPISHAVFSPDGRHVLSGNHAAGSGSITLWDAATGEEAQFFGWDHYRVTAAHFSPDGNYFLLGGLGKTTKLWGTTTGKEVPAAAPPADSAACFTFSPDSRYLFADHHHSIRMWELATGREIRTFTGHTQPIRFLTASPDGKYVFSGSLDSTLKQWEVATGQAVHTTRVPSSFTSLALSADGKYALSGSENGVIRLWELASDKTLQTFEGHTSGITVVAFSGDGKYILSGSRDNTMKQWEAATGREVRAFAGHSGSVNSVAFSHRNRYALSGSGDGTAKLWEVGTGKEVCTVVILNDNEWAVTTPGGLFNASDGAMQLLYYVNGLETIELAQLKDRYYEPGLFQKLLDTSGEKLRDVQGLGEVAPTPAIGLSQPAPHTLDIVLTNRGGGIGRVPVFLNGREAFADARLLAGPELAALQKAPSLRLSVPIGRSPLFRPGLVNQAEVRAYNAEGYLVSRPAYLETPVSRGVQPDSTDSIAPVRSAYQPHLYAVIVGVSQYHNPELNLRFSSKDAQDMARAIQTAGKHLFGDRIHVNLLHSEAEAGSQPTRANIIGALQGVARQATHEDVLVVYLSGHGTNYGGQDGDFYYLTQEASSLTLADPALRETSALSSHYLTETFKQILAQKQLFIVDACASGRVVENLLSRKDVPASTIRALDKMRDRIGSFIITGCAADAASYEASRYGQGLLTYSLLSGIRGGALQNNCIEVEPLLHYAREMVPQLATDIGGIQEPRIFSPNAGSSFTIGCMSPEEQATIELATPKPFFLQTNFQNEDELEDNLRLAQLVDEGLNELSTRGRQSPLVFLDVKEFAGAYSLAGRYKVQPDRITLTVRLSQDKVEGPFSTGRQGRLPPATAFLRDTLPAGGQQIEGGFHELFHDKAGSRRRIRRAPRAQVETNARSQRDASGIRSPCLRVLLACFDVSDVPAYALSCFNFERKNQ